MKYFLDNLSKIWKLLACVRYQGKAITLLLMMLVSMFLETISIGMVIPAVTLLFSGGGVQNGYSLSQWIPANLFSLSHEQIIIYGMLGLGLLFFVKTIFSAVLFWRQTRFAFDLQALLSEKLFHIYLMQSYTFHLQKNSAKLLNTLVNEISLFTFQAVLSGLILILEVLVIIGVGALLMTIELKGTLVAMGLAVIATWVFHLATKEKISRWGQLRQEHDGQRLQHIQQGLSGIKEIKLSGKELFFLNQYQVHNAAAAKIGHLNHAMQQMPKQWLELLAIFILVGLIITMVLQGRSADTILPILGVFAIAAFRLLPSVSRVLVSLQSLRFGLSTVNVLYEEINLPLQQNLLLGHIPKLTSKIELKNITFFYPNTAEPGINNLSMMIRKGEMVGIIGQSGSGKSTLIDIILGLLKPTHGEILIDGVRIDSNLKEWQSQIGYVPQSIYLTDDSIRKNIAFGLAESEIDNQKIRRAIAGAQLDSFINALPYREDSFAGERGIRISGGERQRIGIARALYHDPEILVLDEATSALDIRMAQEVLSSIEKMKGKKTILIIAHQLELVTNCDRIIIMEKGGVIKSGD